MNYKLRIPKRLEQTVRDMLNSVNTRVYLGCSPAIQEVIRLAVQQGIALCYQSDGRLTYTRTISPGVAYALPANVDIIIEKEVPEWVSKKYTVCVVTPFRSNDFRINLPDNTDKEVFGLPAVINCKGWIFKGWLHDGCDLIEASPILYRAGNSFWSALLSSHDQEGRTTSIAYASAWQKDIL